MQFILGEFIFSVKENTAFTNLTENISLNFAKSNTVGNSPTYQFTGKEEETLRLSGTIYPSFKNFNSNSTSDDTVEEVSLKQLKDMSKTGEKYLLSNINGDNLGSWLIKSINQTKTIFGVNGAAQKIEFNISLLKCYE